MTNNKITFQTTQDYNENMPDCNYGCETQYIITDGVYDFNDHLYDGGVKFEQDGNEYIVLDADDEPTGERYYIVKEEPTEEELVG